jgi:sugar lactone lactonase YvrE
MTNLRPEIFARHAAHLGEGPCWHGGRQSLWWVDITGARVMEAPLAGGTVRELALPQMPGAIVVTRRGDFLAALREGFFRLDPDSGMLTPVATAPEHDPRTFRFNDGKVDPQGRFWAGTLALDFRPGQSFLYRLDAPGAVTLVRRGISISNGLAWTPAGRTLYYVDSPTRVVQRFDYDPATGAVGEPVVAFALGAGEGFPDGCSMDAEGCLWLAHWGAAKLTRWDPQAGRCLQTISLPVRNVTSCAFGGPKLDRLFITTAKDDENPAPEPEAGYVFCVEPGVTGLPVNAYAG